MRRDASQQSKDPSSPLPDLNIKLPDCCKRETETERERERERGQDGNVCFKSVSVNRKITIKRIPKEESYIEYKHIRVF